MIWATTLVITIFYLAAAVRPQDQPDAKTFYLDVIDRAFPKALTDYNLAISQFPSSKATPEQIDDLYQATDKFYNDWMGTIIPGLYYVISEGYRGYASAPAAVAAVFNSTPKVEALLPQFKKALNALGTFQPQVIAQGEPGNHAIYEPIDFLAYRTYWAYEHQVRQELSKGKPSILQDVFTEYYKAVEAVRVTYYRQGYDKQPRD